MAQIEHLPDEILEFILAQLFPYQDLENCRLVSRRWCQIVTNVFWQTSSNLIKGLSDFRLCWRTFHHPNKEGTPKIAGRYSHSAVVHKSSMYIFGGGSSEATTFNDLWRFDLSRREWVRPLTMGHYPSPKACASMVCYRNKLILFGGWRHQSATSPYQHLWKLFNELHEYDILENRWTVKPTVGGIPAVARHSATVHEDEMIVFGGHTRDDVTMRISNDVWCLDLRSYIWRKQETSSPKPSPRYGHAQVQLDGKNILIYGGCGGPNNIFRDAWLLTRGGPGLAWKWHKVTVKSGSASAGHIWCNPVCIVGDKLLVLGPNRGTDFQIVKESQFGNRRPAPVDQPVAPPRPADPPRPRGEPEHQVMLREYQNHIEEERMRWNVEHENVLLRIQRNIRRRGQQHPLANDVNELNLAAARLPPPNRLKMAAFHDNNNNNNPNNYPLNPNSMRERQLERLRRINEAMRKNIENDRRQAQPPINNQPPPVQEMVVQRISRTNLLALYVCDLSRVLEDDNNGTGPTVEWLETTKNSACFPGAPEKLILYSLVPGNGELIMFGGLVKESLASARSSDVQVSNALHFLTVPRSIV